MNRIAFDTTIPLYLFLHQIRIEYGTIDDLTV